MNPEGRLVVITGASSGIGRATALELSRVGARLVLAARRIAELEQVAAECRSNGASADVVETDVSDRHACERLIARASGIAPVDILINNAGFAIFDRVTDAQPDELEAMMTTNYFGAVWCTRAVLPAMIARGEGLIINVGSITGIMGFAGMSGYCATKFALHGFTEGLQSEVKRSGVRVALVCPGTTRTDFFITAHHGKMPAASRLLLAIPPERVARKIVKVLRRPRPRTILPLGARIYMRFKEIAPRPAHFLMTEVSRWIGGNTR